MSRRMLYAAAAAAVLAAAPAHAQSLFGTQGLGVPIEPLGARARLLGGIGTGLIGPDASLVNPADASEAYARGVAAAFQPTSELVQLEGAEDRVGATRFPLVRVLIPIRERFVFTAGYGGFLDQSFGIAADRTETIGDDVVAVRDLLQSNGGIARLQSGLAFSPHPRLALGLAGGLYTGEVQRRIVRQFPDTATRLPSFQNLRRWQYGGVNATAGLRWDPLEEVRVAGAVTWSGDLEIESAEGERVGDIPLPLELAVGASAWLSPDLLAAAGARWGGWSSAAGATLPWDPLGPGIAAEDAYEIGGGLEWLGLSGDQSYPVRVGAQYGKLPFHVGGSAPTEWAYGVGFGARLAQTQVGPGALVDLALERGQRGSVETTGLTESFWRFTASLMLFGR